MGENKNEEVIPLNLRINQAKNAVRSCIDQISTVYKLPAPVMELIMESLTLDLRTSNLSATCMEYDEMIAKKSEEKTEE